MSDGCSTENADQERGCHSAKLQANIDKISEQLKTALEPFIGERINFRDLDGIKVAYAKVLEDQYPRYRVETSSDPNNLDNVNVTIIFYQDLIKIDFVIKDGGIVI